MSTLEPINYETDVINNVDNISTKVVLNDYDWMQYDFELYIETKSQGSLNIHIDYFGCITSNMTVRQRRFDQLYEHTMKFDSEIFAKHITRFLTKHIDTWKSDEAFNGYKEAVDFYNEIILNHTDYHLYKILNKTEKIAVL